MFCPTVSQQSQQKRTNAYVEPPFAKRNFPRESEHHCIVTKLLAHLIMWHCLLSFDILFTISTHLRVIILGNACLTAPINSGLLLKCMKNTLERLGLMYVRRCHLHSHFCCR